jgi:hypothetical protein
MEYIFCMRLESGVFIYVFVIEREIKEGNESGTIVAG